MDVFEHMDGQTDSRSRISCSDNDILDMLPCAMGSTCTAVLLQMSGYDSLMHAAGFWGTSGQLRLTAHARLDPDSSNPGTCAGCVRFFWPGVKVFARDSRRLWRVLSALPEGGPATKKCHCQHLCL